MTDDLAAQIARDVPGLYAVSGLKRPAPVVKPAPAREPTETEVAVRGLVEWALKKQLEEAQAANAVSKKAAEDQAAERERAHAAALAEREAIALSARREADEVRAAAQAEANRLRAFLGESEEERQRVLGEHGSWAAAAADKLARAEREAGEWRAKAEAVPAPVVRSMPAEPPKPQALEVVPQHDAAGLLRGLLLKGPLQTVAVKIIRDGAEEPLLLRVEPQ